MGFWIVLPAAAVIAALTAGTAFSDTTTTLRPVANGTYIEWFGDVQDVDEGAAFNCGGADSIAKGGADPDRESFTVDISSVPIGATITSVAVTVRDGAAAADAGGTYQTFARVDSTDTDSGVNLEATAELFDECSAPKAQTIDVPDVERTASTTLEIGVVKTPPDGSAIRIGTIEATVSYDLAPNEAPCILISDTSLSVQGMAATPAQSRVSRLEGFTVTNCGAEATVAARATDATGAAGTWSLADYPRGNPVQNVCQLGPNRFAAWIGMAARQNGGEGGVYLKTQDQPFLDPADESTPFVFPAGDVADSFLQVAMPCVGSLGLGEPMTTQITLTATSAP